jgi:hypothetical protein
VTFPTEQEMDPKHALAAYRACSQTNAQLIEHILAGREGFVLAYNEAEEWGGGMEDAWKNILEVVRRYSVDPREDANLGEWSRLVVSTRKIVDEVLDQFHVTLPGCEDLDLDDYEDELYFSDGGIEDIGVLDDGLVTGKGEVDITGACQWARAAEADVINEYAEFHA